VRVVHFSVTWDVVNTIASREVGESLQSNASDNGDRHLKIVFFDLMYLNGSSLINRSYRERREQLEQIINIIPGYSSSSWRQCIKLCEKASAVKHLTHIFSQHIASHKEGKASVSFWKLEAQLIVYYRPSSQGIKLDIQ
jgi:ATP dependent DNA ligase domain